MRNRFLAPGMLAFFVSILLPAGAADDGRGDVIRQTFPASTGGRLVIEADRGSVTVEGADVAQVEVEVQRKVVRGSAAKAADLLQRHKVTFSQDGGTVKVEADLEGKESWGWAGPQLEVQITARVPQEFNLEASTAGGGIRTAHLKGSVTIRTAGGSLALEDVNGRINGRTSGGSIKGAKLAGNIDLGTAGGSVNVEGATGERLKATTSGGSLHLLGLALPTEARTSGGSIEIETSATPLEAGTSGGGVSATLTAVPKGDVTLKTSGGSVHLRLPADSAFQLDASTSAGSVRSEFPVSTTESGEKSSLRGPVNGGGPTMRLRSSAGSIRVMKS